MAGTDMTTWMLDQLTLRLNPLAKNKKHRELIRTTLLAAYKHGHEEALAEIRAALGIYPSD